MSLLPNEKIIYIYVLKCCDHTPLWPPSSFKNVILLFFSFFGGESINYLSCLALNSWSFLAFFPTSRLLSPCYLAEWASTVSIYCSPISSKSSIASILLFSPSKLLFNASLFSSSLGKLVLVKPFTLSKWSLYSSAG